MGAAHVLMRFVTTFLATVLLGILIIMMAAVVVAVYRDASVNR